MYARAGAKEGLRRFIEAVSLVLWRVGFRRRNVLPVLTYHDVLPASRELEDPYNSIPEDRFELQIRELARNGYSFYTVSDGLAMLRRSGGEPERRVALTFDDGTEGHARIVTPALLRLGATATFYLLSTGFGEEVTVGTRRGRHMSVQDAADMARCGMEIGAHSRTHPILSRLSLDGIREEVAGAREELAKLMGRAPRSFAYPYGESGSFDGRVIDALQEAGYESAVTTVIGTNHPAIDRFRIRRIPVYSTDSPSLVLAKVSGCYDWLRAFQRVWLRAFPPRYAGAGVIRGN